MIYYTGLLGVLVIGLSLLTSIHIGESFGTEYPYLFFIGQAVFLLLIFSSVIKTWFNWQDYGKLTKTDFYLSLVAYICLYIIGWSGFQYSWLLIFVGGLIEIFVTRNRAGLVKSS